MLDTKVNATLDQFVAWLESKPSNEKYDWQNEDTCAMAQFLTEVHGLKNPALETYFPSVIGAQDYWMICGVLPWTFGDALNRAYKLLPRPKQWGVGPE